DLFTPRRSGTGFTPPAEPLPQRRAVDRPVEGELTDDEMRVPRQVPASPEARPTPPDEVIDAVEADVVDDRPAAPPAWPAAPASPPPPAWPPVPAAEAGTAETPAPSVPEELAAALDITSEI